ncbi:DNA translocase FtsK [Helicobacter sp. NHP22-001]|uniref:DNA translocase FtsK n=1 Tax=Helicobacter sp. NHP22-001 TaxID=3040202 RepID=UPI002557C133|nr:DNA translocase FtsK [Helicobacter sp. NHP22-001]
MGWSIKKGRAIKLGFFAFLIGLFLATCLGESGNLGALGVGIASWHLNYLGPIAYLDPIYLFFVWRWASLKSLKGLEAILASLIGFLGLLVGQALLFKQGLVGAILLSLIAKPIGALGAWFVVLAALLYAFGVLFPKSFAKCKDKLPSLVRLGLEKSKEGGEALLKLLQGFKSPPRKAHFRDQTLFTPKAPHTPFEPKDFESARPKSFKIKVSHYQETQEAFDHGVRLVQKSQDPQAESQAAPQEAQEELDHGVRLVPKEPQENQESQEPKNPPPAPNFHLDLSAHKDLLEQRHALQKPKQNALPSLDLLTSPAPQAAQTDNLQEKIHNLLNKLKMFKIEGKVVNTCIGPMVTTFEFRPAGHVKVSKVLSLADDLAMVLCAQSIRIQAPIKGKDVMGIEIANDNLAPIALREILESQAFLQSAGLSLALGKSTTGAPYVLDLKAMPHLLIAGSTGSGKSVAMHALILSLLYKHSPQDLQFIMIDPKRVEFSLYAHLPHLKTSIITDPSEAQSTLDDLVREMEQRYDLLSAKRAKNIDSYNQKSPQKLPFIVVLIDELADLMLAGGKDIETPIIRLAQMGRASGLHLVIATQRPSVDILTGLIKANLPCKISFKVASKVDARVVLDTEGAQNLLGRGDMLLIAPGSSAPIRLHGAFVGEEEIERVVDFIERQGHAKSV